MEIKRASAFIIPFLWVIALGTSCTSKVPEGPKLQILTYSSLGAKGGFLDRVKGDFKQKSGCDLQFETTLGASQILSYLEEPKQRERIDMVMGIDELFFNRARAYLYISPVATGDLKMKFVDFIAARTQLGFYPIDYGALTFIYRKEGMKGLKPPTRLVDLLKPEYKKKFILQDPRAASPGLMFLAFADGILKTSLLKEQWLTLAPNWDSSYKMFLDQEAPMVWSYLTSLAYHDSKHERDAYSYVEFQEGFPLQVEGLALVNRVGNPLTENPCNEKWLQFLYTPEVQTKLVEAQWMMPVLKELPLPKMFATVPAIKKASPVSLNADQVDRMLERFAKEVQGETH